MRNKNIETKFRDELTILLNKNSKENGSNTPDFILAEYMINCLNNFDNTIIAREQFYGKTSASITDCLKLHKRIQSSLLDIHFDHCPLPSIPSNRFLKEGEEPSMSNNIK